jgi:hypothetical protein
LINQRKRAVAKKSKADQQNPTVSAGEKGSSGTAGGGVTGSETKRPARKSLAPKGKKSDPQKKTAAESNPFTGEAGEREPSDEQIRLRAYFIAERRLQLSLPGDSNDDWIEARRQLLAENDWRQP